MDEQLLSLFPPHTHSLTAVSDPDHLLTDESVLSVLTERGFTVIQETDPVLLRNRVEQAKPFSARNPVIVITDDVLEALPYDLWQQSLHIVLALHAFFPNLSYPILRTLTPLQRTRLKRITLPDETLGERRTVEFLLERVFGWRRNPIQEPAYFVLWLGEYHETVAPLPAPILDRALEELHKIPEYNSWPLKEILQDRQAYRNFIQDQWSGFLSLQTGKAIGERRAEYVLRFEKNEDLQDELPRLLRNGSLTPVHLETGPSLPVWVVPGVLMPNEDPRPRRVTELGGSLSEMLAGLTPESRWESWQAIARQWAELSVLHNDLRRNSLWTAPEESSSYSELQSRIDVLFADWLKRRYTPLATQKLPIPHHVHHIPQYLNYLRSQDVVEKIALLVMDGMSLADWLVLKQVWQARQADWLLKEDLVLAQIPTITAISRLALVSGLRPADFYVPNVTKLTETKAWNTYWLREGLPENAVALLALNLERNDPTPEIANPRLQALCLIERQLDEIMHGSTLGEAGHQSAIELWLSGNQSPNSAKLESVLNNLLAQDFTVFITSDHGHCEATGVGIPAEGLMAESHGRRARLYSDHRTAERIQSTYENTILWEADGLLPENLVAVIPTHRQAFTEPGETVVTHGGITIDETVVPLIQLTTK